ncbi:reverse transcriptase [Penicillium cinerascens]|uniref:Reverse transcriptase n=1 Tax=Penicillium cinerascens TaxID=70096 RepID=A0A9W9NB11_9EURO|nr:reverse transcriptase [Penicillium cinerascens]KAJ5215604.1 reverse transcriptase [Penicillium cinerascens]
MPVKRSERGGNASRGASDPPAPDAELIAPTTRSGLVRQMPGTTGGQEIAAEGESGIGSLPGTTQDLARQILEYLQPILRANTELRVANTELGEECKRMSEAYKNVEAIAAEAALYRKELEESRKEVNELHKEIASLKELVQSLPLVAPTTSLNTQTSSPGTSWASIVSQSSSASSNTRATRPGLGLPAVILDLRAAQEETKALVNDPTQTREKIRTALQCDTATASVDIRGVKPTSRTSIKIFVDSEESVEKLHQATHWLNALPGAKLQGEQWFPIKLNDVKKESVFGVSGIQREGFARNFQDENGVTEIKKLIWLSGKKRQGSMAVYLSKQADAEALLSRRIAHVYGEAVFSDTFYERPRPLRCRKCQQYNHKEDRCPNSVACDEQVSLRMVASRTLRVAQANLRRGPETQLSLLNDQSLRSCDLLLISEPYVFLMNGAICSHAHTHWTPLWPSQRHQSSGRMRPYRSMIWVNKMTFPHRQIDVSSPDITAVLIFTPSPILIVSVYVPPEGGPNGVRSLTQVLEIIRYTYQRVRCDHTDNVDILIAGDFNRHDQLWGGDQVATHIRQGEAEPILLLMADWDLTSLLPRGTITFEEGPWRSTIDLVLASRGLGRRMTECGIHPVEHGSDHRAIITTFLSDAQKPTVSGPGRPLFREAPWADINRELKDLETEVPDITTRAELNSTVDHLTNRVSQAVRLLVPIARPSPYSKRWWTPELTVLRDTYTRARNRCTQSQRYGVTVAELEDTVSDLRRQYHRAIRDAKRHHWREFLNNSDNIWKAARYLEPGERSIGAIPTLRSNNQTFDNDQEKAYALLQAFFPPLPNILDEPQEERQQPDPLPMETIAPHEVEAALMKMAPWKAPGPDGLPAVVWQQIWSTVKHWVTEILQASLRFAYFPKAWRVAKIVVLLKGGRDPSLPKSYRPISLLATLGKVLEAVVANRISTLVEKHQLLPANHFGARRRRSCEQALNVLVEKIHDAWREGKVLSLVSFDVKGAYNGVDGRVLLRRLRERRIPLILVRWIDSFCFARRASIVVNRYQSEEVDIRHAGLPQGSPLSPILFLFFNANLVDVPITRRKGAIAFVDDYTRWTVGLSAEANTITLQKKVIPRALEWAARSGAAFEAEKTSFIHFTRNLRLRQLPATPLYVDGAAVTPAPEVKILGVLLDQELRFKSHIGKAASKGMKAILALRRLRGLPPSVARQLFIATVASKIDYAASVWCPARKDTVIPPGIGRLFESIQRIAAQAIIGVIRTTALAIAEAEAGIESTYIRLRARIIKHWINCHTLPKDHPFWQCRAAAVTQDSMYPSPFKILAVHGPQCLSDMEVIRPFPLDPWQQSLCELITSRGSALDDLHEASCARLWLYTSVSVRNGLVGTGLVVRVNQADIATSSRTVGSDDVLNAHYAQLGAILEACLYVRQMLHRIQMSPWKIQTIFVVSNPTVLQSLAKPHLQGGQTLITQVTGAITQLSEMGPRIYLRPAREEPGEGAKKSHNLARDATTESRAPDPPPWAKIQLRASALRWARSSAVEHRKSVFRQSVVSQYTRQLDSALPGPHTKIIYDCFDQEKASVLAQLRTGHARLNGYLHRIGQSESDLCACGVERETVQHFLLLCTQWNEQRRALIDAAGSNYGSLSYMLGGKPDSVEVTGEQNGRPWKPDIKVVKAVVAFAVETKRLAYGGC